MEADGRRFVYLTLQIWPQYISEFLVLALVLSTNIRVDMISYLAKHDTWYEKLGKSLEGVYLGLIRRAAVDVYYLGIGQHFSFVMRIMGPLFTELLLRNDWLLHHLVY